MIKLNLCKKNINKCFCYSIYIITLALKGRYAYNYCVRGFCVR